MPKLWHLAKIVGPKGALTKPNLGTVTNNIQSSVKAVKAGQVEIRNDKDGNIGASIGKKDFVDSKVKEMLDHNGTVIFDCHVDPNESRFPMIPSGKPNNQMIIGPKDKEETKITEQGKTSV